MGLYKKIWLNLYVLLHLFPWSNVFIYIDVSILYLYEIMQNLKISLWHLLIEINFKRILYQIFSEFIINRIYKYKLNLSIHYVG